MKIYLTKQTVKRLFTITDRLPEPESIDGPILVVHKIINFKKMWCGTPNDPVIPSVRVTHYRKVKFTALDGSVYYGWQKEGEEIRHD